MTARKRPSMPTKVKLDVVIRQEGKCACGCGEKLGTLRDTEFDHVPALALRDYDEATGIFDPAANDPTRIFAKIKDHHALKTKKDRRAIKKATNPKRQEKFVVRKPPLREYETAPSATTPEGERIATRCRKCGEWHDGEPAAHRCGGTVVRPQFRRPRSMDGSKDSPWKKPLRGAPVRREGKKQ